ncbi:MAG TPA: DNA translocase FtsK 4TM domain-containing protein, partial [Burkholderiaceae bacterium]|nr:DNA translocase FtsK 4TM domain-containing protein [Burkholderiaceae bacterium]
MTFPLGSLASSDAKSGVRPQAGAPRWRAKVVLVVGAVVWLLVVLALATHDLRDTAYFTSGGSDALHNRAGKLGAWMSDGLLGLFGYSAWWLLVVGARWWLSGLANFLRDEPVVHDHAALPRAAWVCGIVLLVAASCALESTRLYRFDSELPGGHAGGGLGYLLGDVSVKWLGFAGSGVAWIAALVLGASMALRFSWIALADRIGSAFDALRERRQEAIERAEDLRIGKALQIERDRVLADEQQVIEEHVPIVIEKPLAEVPKSERVAKERQQPLFSELHDAKLPQVDLLDAPPGRVESVTPDSLEMTSRLIEKKLKDFGVDVRVVAASPGPVITRYEIEPAIGVKGAQVVNLAKDLARSLSLVSIRVVEVIPGKNYMALELPNARRQTIRLA